MIPLPSRRIASIDRLIDCYARPSVVQGSLLVYIEFPWYNLIVCACVLAFSLGSSRTLVEEVPIKFPVTRIFGGMLLGITIQPGRIALLCCILCQHLFSCVLFNRYRLPCDRRVTNQQAYGRSHQHQLFASSSSGSWRIDTRSTSCNLFRARSFMRLFAYACVLPY